MRKQLLAFMGDSKGLSLSSHRDRKSPAEVIGESPHAHQECNEKSPRIIVEIFFTLLVTSH